MPVLKEFRCDVHGDFESVLPICPVCKKIARRVFLTAPGIGRVAQQNVDRILADVLPEQNLVNYSNATGYPRPTFSNVYTNTSGFSAGWGLDALKELGVPRGAEMTKMDLASGQRTAVNLEALAASLPQAVSAEPGARVGDSQKSAKGDSVLRSMTLVERRYQGS